MLSLAVLFRLSKYGPRQLAFARGILTIVYLGAVDPAEAACTLPDQPNFVHVPMKVAILASTTDAELFKEVSYVNSNQDSFRLTLLPGIEPISMIEKASSEYDAVLVLDRQMMLGNAPKYNRYLFAYRDKDLSNETMIVDFKFDSKYRIGSTFLQIAAVSARAQSLLMEIGLMALADGLQLDENLLSYYRKVDSISAYEDGQISQSTIRDILIVREQIIIGCFLRED